MFLLSSASVNSVYETYSQIQIRKDSGPTSIGPLTFAWGSRGEALDDLLSMSKRQLVEAFMQCEEPSPSDLYGCVYDGFLLENGPVLSPVTSFITNRLFGGGDRWLGKSYSEKSEGMNRFKPNGKAEYLDRTFTYKSKQSGFPSTTSRSLFNLYRPHCSRASPFWGGMVDEIRVIPIKGERKSSMLLGMGYFTWSGGMLNSAPFCLVKKEDRG